MKNALTFVIVLLPLLLFAQKRDTSLVSIGEYESMEIKEIHKVKVGVVKKKYTKEEIATKKYRPKYVGPPYRELDSIIYFHENEKIKKIEFVQRRYNFNYDENWNLTFIEKGDYGNSSIVFWENLTFEIKELTPQVYGKFGNNIPFKFGIKNNSKEVKELNLSSNDDSIRLQSSKISIPPHEELSLSIVIKVDTEEKKKLVFSNEKNQKFDFPIEVIGYDLDDSDFLSTYFYKDKLPIDIGDRENLLIKLESGERLLKIYKEGKLIWNHPIPQIINQVDVAYFEGGEYLLEIIDLKTNGKKYCRIQKKGAD